MQYQINPNKLIKPIYNKGVLRMAAVEQDDKNIQEFNKFLKNNEELLQEKYKQYFIKDSLKITDANPAPEVVVKYISDVFSFDKNNSAEGMLHKIESSLKGSYKQFLNSHSHIKQFNSKVALDLLKFCIVNNQLFAVQYEMTSHPQKNQRNVENSKQAVQGAANQQNHQQGQRHNREEGSDVMHNRSQMSNEFDQGGLNRRNSSNFDMENQFNFHEQIKPEFDPLVIKKNTKVVFEYYCKQQMSLAPNLSFDQIERESHYLNMSKFIMMARLMNMFNSVITKNMLIKKFRKISEGKRQIDFKQFDVLLSQLQVQDPTLVARSELSNPNIQAFLKSCKKPFDTQDMMPRELIKNRAFNKKLTMHGGKMEEDLRADLQTKKSAILYDNPVNSQLKYLQDIVSEARTRNNSLQKARSKQLFQNSRANDNSSSIRYSQISRVSPQIVSTKKLLSKQRIHARNYSQDMHFIQKIIPASNDDDKWLGQYKIKLPLRGNQRSMQKHEESSENRRSFQGKQARNALLIQDLKNRIKQIERTQHDSSSLEETKAYLGSVSSSRRY